MKYEFDSRIMDAAENLELAKRKFNRTIEEVQSECDHPVIHYQEGFYSEIGGNRRSFVSCTNCGLTHFDHYGEFGPFGRKGNLNRPLQPKEMEYYEALSAFKLGEGHDRH